MGVTLKDIAKACGVDVSTVSRALRDDPRVKIETRDGVSKAARELGYQPNFAARSLVAGKTRCVWSLMSSPHNTLERGPVTFAGESLLSYGYDLLLAPYYGKPDVYDRLLRRLSQGVADGALIFTSFVERSPDGYEPLIARGVPMVFMDRYHPGLNVSAVTSDNAYGARRLCELAFDAGAEGIVSLFGSENAVLTARRDGVANFVRETGAPYARVNVSGVALETDETLELAALQKLRKILIIGTGQNNLLNFTAENRDFLQDKTLFFGAFDEWKGEPAPAKIAFYCEQDFETMATCAVDHLMSLISSETLPRARIIHVPPLAFHRVTPRF